jgi:hypothetical protein
MSDLTEYGLLPQYETMLICTTCGGLFGPAPLGQRCACDRTPQAPWPGYDFNEQIRLCDCCGRFLLPSGRRWSIWFCGPCKERVILLNQEFGFPLIPLGRHSLVNGLGLSGGPGRTPPSDDQIERFAEALGGLFDRMTILNDEWKPAHLRSELVRLGLLTGHEGEAPHDGGGPGPSVRLMDYLTRVAEEDRTTGVDHRVLAFKGLAGRFMALVDRVC